MTHINEKATRYLKQLKRIEEIPNESISFEDNILLFPDNADLVYTDKNIIITTGLGEKLDKIHKDLLTFIKIKNPLNVEFEKTKILMPRNYAESLDPIAQHISVQAIILSKVTEAGVNEVLRLIKQTNYNKTPYDKIWIENSDPREKLHPGKIVMIMNRRVGGWDGSRDRPVIELLGGGGHVPTVWNESLRRFQQMDPIDTVIMEFSEELSYELTSGDVDIIGGYHNLISNELVILCGVFVPFYKIIDIQNDTLGNFKANIDGIYLGTFRDVMKIYLENAEPFAGGERVKATNFPSQIELMKRIYQRLGV